MNIADKIAQVSLNTQYAEQVKSFIAEGNMQKVEEILDSKEMEKDKRKLKRAVERSKEAEAKLKDISRLHLIKADSIWARKEKGWLEKTRSDFTAAIECHSDFENNFEYAGFLYENKSNKSSTATLI